MDPPQIRDYLYHLLYAHFAQPTDVEQLNADNDGDWRCDISRVHMWALVEIILYTSNPILCSALSSRTHTHSLEMLTNSTLRFKLPPPLLAMIAYRHSGTSILDNEIIKVAADIVQAARQNELFYMWKNSGELRWGYSCEQVEADYPNWRQYDDTQIPSGVEGWVPVTIHFQSIWIRQSRLVMYGDAETNDSLSVYLYGPHNNHIPRFITRDVLNDRPAPEDIADIPTSEYECGEWIKVRLCKQTTWIYYDGKGLSTLPQSSIRENYIQLTVDTAFPQSRGSVYFAERIANDGVFRHYPKDTPRFVDDEDEYINGSQEDPFTKTIIIDVDTSQPNFRTMMERELDEENEGFEMPLYIEWHPCPIPNTIMNDPPKMCPVSEFINIFDGSPYIDNDKTFLTAIRKVSLDDVTIVDIESSLWIDLKYRDHYYPDEQTSVYNTMFVNLSKLFNMYGFGDVSVDLDTKYNEFLSKLNGISFTPPAPRKPVATHPPIKSVPKYIRDILVDYIVAKKEECPITTEVITAENIAITTCFHFFDKAGITRWLAQDATCPQCRESAALIP